MARLAGRIGANMAPTERTQLLDSIPRLISFGTGTSRIRERYSEPLLPCWG